MRHRHTTPFDVCEIKYHIKLPIFVARQWIRHRTANVNDYSERYSILNNEFYIPDKTHLDDLFEEKIIERFGFNYSQTENYPIIDTLDYGTDDIDYLHFIQLMREFEVRKKRGEWYPNA